MKDAQCQNKNGPGFPEPFYCLLVGDTGFEPVTSTVWNQIRHLAAYNNKQ